MYVLQYITLGYLLYKNKKSFAKFPWEITAHSLTPIYLVGGLGSQETILQGLSPEWVSKRVREPTWIPESRDREYHKIFIYPTWQLDSLHIHS